MPGIHASSIITLDTAMTFRPWTNVRCERDGGISVGSAIVPEMVRQKRDPIKGSEVSPNRPPPSLEIHFK